MIERPKVDPDTLSAIRQMPAALKTHGDSLDGLSRSMDWLSLAVFTGLIGAAIIWRGGKS
jgi:hypothetical protein